MIFLKKITSSSNDEIKSLAKLHENARERKKQGLLILEGFHLLQAAVEAGLQVKSVYLDEKAEYHADWLKLAGKLASASCSIVNAAILSKVTTLATPPEVVSVCQRPVPLMAVGDGAVMLDGVRDPGNLGTILRSAAAANVRNIYLSAECADVFSPKVLRSAMGAHFSVNIFEQADLPVLLGQWQGASIATSLEQSCSLYEMDLTGNTAMVFGNEGAGVSAEVMRACSQRVRIPMPGQAESLNVAMAATVCLFERVRQLQAN